MFLEAPEAWIRKVYVRESITKEDPELYRTIQEKTVPELVADPVFRQMSDTCTPQGVLTLLSTPAYRPEDLGLGEQDGPSRELYLVLEDLQDPGNLGMILRTAEAAGVRGVLMTTGSVDITGPKVIRSTMGAIYRLPWLTVAGIREAKALLSGRGIHCYAADLRGSSTYDHQDYTGGTAFFIGNEGNGLTPEASACADIRIRIPMCGKTESLNAAMAAGILMYEAYRQRRG